MKTKDKIGKRRAGWVALLIGLLAVTAAQAGPPVTAGTFVSPAILGSITNTTLYSAAGTPVPIPRGNFDLIILTSATAAQSSNSDTLVYGFDLSTTTGNGTTYTSEETPLLATNTLNGTNYAWTSWTRFTAAQLAGATAINFTQLVTTSGTAVTNNGVNYAFVPSQ